MGKNPKWLHFDSKLPTYEELSPIPRKKDVSFVTIRRRGSDILKRLQYMPKIASHDAVIDIPCKSRLNVGFDNRAGAALI